MEMHVKNAKKITKKINIKTNIFGKNQYFIDFQINKRCIEKINKNHQNQYQ